MKKQVCWKEVFPLKWTKKQKKNVYQGITLIWLIVVKYIYCYIINFKHVLHTKSNIWKNRLVSKEFWGYVFGAISSSISLSLRRVMGKQVARLTQRYIRRMNISQGRSHYFMEWIWGTKRSRDVGVPDCEMNVNTRSRQNNKSKLKV